MFAEGSYIMYRNLGVCQVEKIGHPENTAFRQEVEYYTLRPIRRDGVIYVPVDSKVKMRAVVSRSDADNLIDSLPRLEAEICSSRDRRVIQEFDSASMQSQSVEDLARLIKSINKKEKLLIEKGKKLGSIDAEYRRQAQELLFDELSCVLGIPYDEMEEYIRLRLERAAN